MKLKNFISTHKSDLCFGFGMAMYVGSIIEIVRATVRVTHKIDRIKKEIADESLVSIDPKDVQLPVKVVLKTALPEYASSIVLMISSVGLITYGKTADNKEKAELMSACMLTKNAADLYKESTVDVVGEAKEKKIREHMAEKSADQNIKPQEAECTGDGNTLYYIPYFMYSFRSSPEKVNGGIYEFKENLWTENMSGLEFIQCLGAFPDQYGSNVASSVGWKQGTKLDVKVLWKENSPEPCGLIMFDVDPEVEFDKNH